MSRFQTFSALVILTAQTLTVGAAVGQDLYAAAGDESASFTVETLLTNLASPCGLVAAPTRADSESNEIYFSESSAGRVVWITADDPHRVRSAITGFATSESNNGWQRRLGPMGLAFLTPTKLAVGSAEMPAGEDLVRVYALAKDDVAVSAEAVDHIVGPVTAADRFGAGDGDFFSLGRTPDTALYVATGGGSNQGSLLKAPIAANHLVGLGLLPSANDVAGVHSPTCVTFTPTSRPQYVVVGDAGDPTKPRDSCVLFHSSVSGTQALRLPTGLHDIVGLAYSPSEQLYAVDYAAADPSSGGVYRLDDALVNGRQACRAVKIAPVDRPTSLVFTPDGVLYVTAFGDGENDGALLRITGDL